MPFIYFAFSLVPRPTGEISGLAFGMMFAGTPMTSQFEIHSVADESRPECQSAACQYAWGDLGWVKGGVGRHTSARYDALFCPFSWNSRAASRLRRTATRSTRPYTVVTSVNATGYGNRCSSAIATRQ